MQNLKESELKILYANYTKYRDIECNGFAKMKVSEFFSIHGLNEK